MADPASTVKNKRDFHWMAEALKLAQRGLYTTSPNPRVGCVIVSQADECIGRGVHLQAGCPHAEVHALNEAGTKAQGATAYVTLEPCSHFGKTPPCADALIGAGVGRVVIAMTDPNPQVSGQGSKRLADAGIEVTTGIMADEASTLNKGFVKRMKSGKPFVTVKLACSLDGKIALANGESQWITGPEARQDVQRFRARSCAVLTGSGTVAQDNPSLLVRPEQANIPDYPLNHYRQPLRVVVNALNSLGCDYQIFNDGHPTLRAVADDNTDEADAGRYLCIPRQGHRLDLTELLQTLGKREINEVWTEAGPGLAGALIRAGEVDELIVYQAGLILGENAQSMLTLGELTSLDAAPRLTLTETRHIGNDLRLRYRFNTSSSK